MHKRLRNIKQWYKYLPTTLTLGNSLCGFTAILLALSAYAPDPGERIGQVLAQSAWLIVFAMIFDMLDGWTARVLKAMSEHGQEMDSLADMVTFGVAPAVLVAVMAHRTANPLVPYRLVWGFAAIYLACVALRLALYNVLARLPGQHDSFQGLPSPGGAAAVSTLLIYCAKSDHGYQILTNVLPFYAAVMGFLMVSSIPYGHLGHWLGNKRHNKLKILLLIAFFIAFRYRPALVAALAANGYVISGPLTAVVKWLWRHSPLHSPVPEHDASDGNVAP